MATAVSSLYNWRVQDTIRAFIAIHLPQDVKAYLGHLAEDLGGQVPNRSVRWVKPNRMHLTLRFIGETEKNLLAQLGHALDNIANQHQPFSLQLAGFGCFPNCKRPRVLWAGVGGELEAASRLKADIDAALEPLGWKAENRPFQPHLTIGRVKESRAVSGQRWPNELTPLLIPADSIHLIESELTPNGPIYTVRHSSSLQVS
jgi:RNA 2',3'-cyclic 3'-phosphodiesterase